MTDSPVDRRDEAKKALAALAEYDETRNTMRLLRDLNRIAGRPDEEEDEQA